MITVIIAGGSGTRLWPLSTPEFPKHLLSLIGSNTLLQNAYIRAKTLGDTIYVVTEAGHATHVKEQLHELPESAFLIEPGRRGTAHCITFALDVIARTHDKDEPIAFIHSDHHVRDVEGFTRSFEIAAQASKDHKKIVLIGIEPTNPSTSFGYIERDGILPGSRAYQVTSFKEKPDYEIARSYVESGRYLWNCGYFVGSVHTFIHEMETNAPELKADFDQLTTVGTPGTKEYDDVYLALDNQVIDIALIEKAKAIGVVPATFDWMDVGSFKDLHDVVSRDESGNYIHGERIYSLDVENTYVRNEEQKPVAVIGLDNVIVVNTPNGILVARKDVSQRVGEIAKRL